ncbi:MAG: ATP-binding protein [Mariniphaga sp.]
MRYLNRIIFINSAHIKYAEINLDGNVHFIGTQGVGKSTVLRAILFFYNGDTLKLGIPLEKKTYTDYYFAHPNSYIIYEVVRDEEKFCVVSFKSQHKVHFRFFDGAYNQKYFVSKTGIAPDNWEGIARQLDADQVYYTKRKIDIHNEYRDILYGNHENRKSEFRKYALLESKDYQNIPKTIQNVFLNSKMEAEFIKQTIIMSLENDVQIDLNKYTHHLKDFETQLADIHKFKRPGTTAQANTIAKLHIAIRHLEREKIKLAKELSSALREIQVLEPVLTEKYEKADFKKRQFAEKLLDLSKRFQTKKEKIQGLIIVLKSELDKVKAKAEEYNRIGIEVIISRVSKKHLFDKELKNLLEEKELFLAQFKELAYKFQVMLDNLENQWNDFLNMKSAEKLAINTAMLGYKEETRKSYEKIIASLRVDHKKGLDEARLDWENKKQATHVLKLQKEGLKHKRFFEDEIKSLEKQINEYLSSNQKINLDNEGAAHQIDAFQKNWELEEKDIKKSLEREVEKINGQIDALKLKIEEIDQYLINSKSSLYGWLSDNYDGWEANIGKVIDEKNVLFNSSLSPKLSPRTNGFYGIELDLDGINKKVKTVADYIKEKTSLTDQVDAARNAVSDLTEKAEKEKENLKKKYHPKIREKKDLIKGNEYLAEQNKARANEATVKLNDFINKATTEKIRVIEHLDGLIEKATETELKSKDEVTRIEEELVKLIRSKEREREKKIDVQQDKANQDLIKVEAAILIEKEAILKRKGEISVLKEQELSSKGVDTNRLSAIETKMEIVQKELDYIEENRDIVSEYNKDKRELFDKTDEFKAEKLQNEKLLEAEERKYEQQKETINSELSLVQDVIKSLSDTLNRIKEDNEAFNNFNGSECYHSIEEFVTNPLEEHKTEKRVKNLIDEIKEIHYDKLYNRLDEIRKTITDFLGKFSDDNIFKFKKQLTDTKSFLDFAEMLSDFVEENKMERIEKEVNERFSLIITTIGKETTDLVSESGRIQNVVNKINDDFVKRNFAGVIKKIELRIADSKNNVVQLLIQIMEYNKENNFNIGIPNLFSMDNQDKKNKDAINLLKQFIKEISDIKKDTISLSDSFELSFRIEENQNDTGWVEKLSNVGSDGTDVLVKAMVNIMLLNVFKEGASKRFRDFRLHCMMDEIGKLHPNNVRGILKFANDRNIFLINSSPIENDALAFKHIYKLKKDEKSITRVNRIMTQYIAE